ncbi:hypothetical protein Tco_0123027 [Tanacetum coccineum]
MHLQSVCALCTQSACALRTQSACALRTQSACALRTQSAFEYGVSTSIGYDISSSLSNTEYSSQQINTAYPLPLDTTYRSSETEILKELQEVMAEPILSNNMEKAPTELNLSITSNDINIELSKEFLVELRKNIYHGTYNEDVVDHITKGDEQITTWEELVEKFFCRLYPESYDGEDEISDEGDN